MSAQFPTSKPVQAEYASYKPPSSEAKVGTQNQIASHVNNLADNIFQKRDPNIPYTRHMPEFHNVKRTFSPPNSGSAKKIDEKTFQNAIDRAVKYIKGRYNSTKYAATNFLKSKTDQPIKFSKVIITPNPEEAHVEAAKPKEKPPAQEPLSPPESKRVVLPNTTSATSGGIHGLTNLTAPKQTTPQKPADSNPVT